MDEELNLILYVDVITYPYLLPIANSWVISTVMIYANLVTSVYLPAVGWRSYAS